MANAPRLERTESSRSFTCPAPPTEVRPPAKWKSHEAEFLDTMCPTIFSESTNPEKWYQSSLYKANYFAKQLGTIYPKDFLDLRQEDGLMSLSGRMLTFPEDWAGWPPLDMALTGLYFGTNEKVNCCVCGVMFRKLTSRNIPYLQRHKDVAPFCLALKRYQCEGTRPTGEEYGGTLPQQCTIYE